MVIDEEIILETRKEHILVVVVVVPEPLGETR
jgi:hypothetical protein